MDKALSGALNFDERFSVNSFPLQQALDSMRNICVFCTLVIVILLVGNKSAAQDFSNKGKEFWLCFPSHVPSGGQLANMSLFITSDKNSKGSISVNGFNVNFAVTANQIAGPINIPYGSAYIQDAESGTTSTAGT